MGGDERRPFATRLHERGVDASIDADEGAAADGDGVRGESWIEVVDRQLEPGQEEQVVLAPRALGLRLDLGEVVRVVARRQSARDRVGGSQGSSLRLTWSVTQSTSKPLRP